jgi:hypothetical protein
MNSEKGDAQNHGDSTGAGDVNRGRDKNANH